MTKQEAINAMQAHLGDLHLVIDVDRDSDGDWIGCVVLNDNDGHTIGSISLMDHGRTAPQVWWD